VKLVRRDPGAAYLDSWLWLPKSHVSGVQVRGALSYIGRDDRHIQAWEEEPHHYRVPRNYLQLQALRDLPFPTFDARYTAFPRVRFRSKVTLDAREPSKTYQREGAAALLQAHDGILCLRCGAGKTVVALHAAAQLGVPVLIVVDDKGLAKQWLTEIEQFLDIDMKDVGTIWGGKKFDWRKPITVATVQTLASRIADGTLPAEMTRHFGLVLLDEAHVMGAPYFNTAIPPFHGRRWGLSATPYRDDDFASLLTYTVGPVLYTYLTPDLKPTVYFKRLDTRLDYNQPMVQASTHDTFGKFHYGMAYGHLARAHPERTNAIVAEVQAAVSAGRQVLVLSHSREMVESLAHRFPNGGVTHGGVGDDEHWRVVRECNPVVAIMKRGKQALNKPSLDTVFICDPFSKPSVLQQTMGRALRAFGDKKEPLIIFFEDKNVSELSALCGKIRRSLSRWPAHKGGRIPFKLA